MRLTPFSVWQTHGKVWLTAAYELYSVLRTPCTMWQEPCSRHLVYCVSDTLSYTVWRSIPCTVWQEPCTMWHIPCTVCDWHLVLFDRHPVLFDWHSIVWQTPCTVWLTPCTVWQTPSTVCDRVLTSVTSQYCSNTSRLSHFVQRGTCLIILYKGGESSPLNLDSPSLCLPIFIQGIQNATLSLSASNHLIKN